MATSHVDFVHDRIKFDKEKITDGSLVKIEVEVFNLEDFWTQFDAAVQGLSNEVTKIGFMCGQEPYPKNSDLENMMSNLLQYYNMMRDLYSVLPEDVGQTLYKLITSAVVKVMSTLLGFVHSLKDLSEKGAKERLSITGTVWEACKDVQTLPRDNVKASLLAIESEKLLASDALDELHTAIEEDQECESWNDEERDLVQRAVGLVKVSKTCVQQLKKVVEERGSCESSETCIQLDLTNEVAQKVSPALDEFVSELYPPIHIPTALQTAGILAEVLHEVVSNIAKYEGVDVKDVVKKLRGFINHNHARVDPCSGNPVSNLFNLSLNE